MIVGDNVYLKTVGTGVYLTSGSRVTINNSTLEASGTMFSTGGGAWGDSSRDLRPYQGQCGYF